MTRRAPIRLVRLLAVACACLLPAAAAHAQPPDNDTPTSAADVPPLGWTSLSVSQDIVLQASDWADATTGPDDADPLPSCTGAIGFRSMWYALTVSEASVLRVSVISTDTARYQPVVTVLAGNDEIACGVAALGRPGATANATAYVTPMTDATGIRSPDLSGARGPGAQQHPPRRPADAHRALRGTRRDPAPDRRELPGGPCSRGPGRLRRLSTDHGSNIDSASPTWRFYDGAKNDVMKAKKGMRVSYQWRRRARAASTSTSRTSRATRACTASRRSCWTPSPRLSRSTCVHPPPVRTGCGSSSRPPSRCACSCWSRRPGARAAPAATVAFWGVRPQALDPAERRSWRWLAGHQRHRARSRRQCHPAAAVRCRSRLGTGQLPLAVTLPSQVATDM